MVRFFGEGLGKVLPAIWGDEMARLWSIGSRRRRSQEEDRSEELEVRSGLYGIHGKLANPP